MGSPQRRLTSVLTWKIQVGTKSPSLKFPGTSPVYCCYSVRFPYLTRHRSKTLLAVTNAAVEPQLL